MEFNYYFQIFLQKVSKPTKTTKKVYSFYNTVSLKKTHSFYEPKLNQHCKKYALATQPKTCFWLVSEKTFVLHHFQTPQNYIPGALGNQVSVYSCKSPFKHFLFQRLRKLLSGGELNNFLQALFGTLKMLLVFFNTSINSIKTLKFSWQFGLQK